MKEDPQNKIQILVGLLSSPQSDGYLQRKLPCELDALATNIVDDYIKGTDKEKSAILANFGPNQSFAWLAYAERMASLAVRELSRLILFRGLIALIIEGFKLDARENILVLSLLNHSASKIKIDASVLFEEAARLAPEATAMQFRCFLNRSPDQKNIKVMGYEEQDCEGGLLYLRNW